MKRYRRLEDRIARQVERRLRPDGPVDVIVEDGLTKGERARLSEAVRWLRWAVYALWLIVGMVALFFLRDAVTVLLALLG